MLQPNQNTPSFSPKLTTTNAQMLDDNTTVYVMNQIHLLNTLVTEQELKISKLESQLSDLSSKVERIASKPVTLASYARTIGIAPQTLKKRILQGYVSKDCYFVEGKRFKIYPELCTKELTFKNRIIND